MSELIIYASNYDVVDKTHNLVNLINQTWHEEKRQLRMQNVFNLQTTKTCPPVPGRNSWPSLFHHNRQSKTLLSLWSTPLKEIDHRGLLS